MFLTVRSADVVMFWFEEHHCAVKLNLLPVRLVILQLRQAVGILTSKYRQNCVLKFLMLFLKPVI